jgi:hypothetical protein
MQGKMLIEFLSHLSGYQMTAIWKEVDARPEKGKERLRVWHVEIDEKDKKQVTRFLESMCNTNQRKIFPLEYKLLFLFDVKDSIGIHGRDKAQKLFDRHTDFIKIHTSVRVPGVKEAYYEDKRAGSLADFSMSLKSKGTSKQLFHSLDQAKGTGTCYSLSFIDMYDMKAREVIHNLAEYLGHHHGTWVYKYFAAEYVELAQTCYWHEESQSMISNKEQMWDNLMNWDTEFQVQIENMKNMENMDAAPPGAAAQTLVGSVDSISFMDRHTSAVSNNPRSMDASNTPPLPQVNCFPKPPFPPT